MKTLHKLTKLLFCSLLALLPCLGAQAQYCIVDFTNGVQPMTLVDFAGISNATSATGGTTYEDFTAMTGTVIQGGTNTITVKGNTFGNYSDNYRVFYDWSDLLRLIS